MGITPVSCRIRNPFKTWKRYHLIHKAEKQLVYERVRNINKILYTYENKRAESYSKLRSLIQGKDISKCILFINKIKEIRHNKIIEKQINTFNCLLRKSNVYHHSFGFLADTAFLVDTPTVVYTYKTTGFPAVPLLQPQHPLHPLHQQPNPLFQHTKELTTKKWVINLSNTFLTPVQESFLARGPNLTVIPEYCPRNLILQWWRRHVPDFFPGRQRNL